MRDPTLRFGACAKRQCLTVDIINDNLIEDTETFTVTLQHPPTGGGTDSIVLDPTVATVTIKDEDGTFVGIDITLRFHSVFSVLSLQWRFALLTERSTVCRKQVVV